MRYHFHVCTTGEMVKDEVGRELTDVSTAKGLARRYAKLLQSKAAYRKIAFRVIEIRSDTGKLIASIPFSKAAPVARGSRDVAVRTPRPVERRPL